MKFRATEDVDAPPGPVWRQLTDFTLLEREAKGRGAEVERLGGWTTPREGVEWQGAVTVRGMRRAMRGRITRFEPDASYVIDTRIGGMDCHVEMDFIPLSPAVTRVGMVLDLSADTMAARLMLQSLKLARGSMLQRLQAILARQGNAAEAAWRAAPR